MFCVFCFASGFALKSFWRISMTSWSPPGKPTRQVFCGAPGKCCFAKSRERNSGKVLKHGTGPLADVAFCIRFCVQKIWRVSMANWSPPGKPYRASVFCPARQVFRFFFATRHLPGRPQNTCRLGFAGGTPVCRRFSRFLFRLFCNTTLSGQATKHLPGRVCRGDSNLP